jgi:hypothetical protein
MTSETADFPSLPDLPTFDRNALRKAVRRGVIRTAIVGGFWVLIALFLLQIAGGIITSVLGRADELTHVVQVGWQVSHPEFFAKDSGTNTGGMSANLRIDAVPVSAGLGGAATQLSFRDNIFGSTSVSGVADPQTAASQVLLGFGQPGSTGAGVRAAEVKMLRGLPSAVRVAAIVEFANPLSFEQYRAFAQAHDDQSAPAFGLAPALLSAAIPLGDSDIVGGHLIRGVYAWSPTYDRSQRSGEFQTVSDVVSGFRTWVHTLHDSDRDALLTAGADLTGLRAAARAGLVHGVVLKDASAAFLLKLLADPSVGAVHPYDVQFAVEGIG